MNVFALTTKLQDSIRTLPPQSRDNLAWVPTGLSPSTLKLCKSVVSGLSHKTSSEAHLLDTALQILSLFALSPIATQKGALLHFTSNIEKAIKANSIEHLETIVRLASPVNTTPELFDPIPDTTIIKIKIPSKIKKQPKVKDLPPHILRFEYIGEHIPGVSHKAKPFDEHQPTLPAAYNPATVKKIKSTKK